MVQTYTFTAHFVQETILKSIRLQNGRYFFPHTTNKTKVKENKLNKK